MPWARRTILFVNDDLYIMQRSGHGGESGLIFVLNNRGTWNGTVGPDAMEQHALSADRVARARRSRHAPGKIGLTIPAGLISGRRHAAT